MKVVTIGRSQDNDHVVIDPSVSRHHCQIVLTDDGKYMILDMGSVNGTFVNGCRITSEIPVAPSDKVRIGKVELDWTVLFEQTVSGRAQANSLSGSVAETCSIWRYSAILFLRKKVSILRREFV